MAVAIRANVAVAEFNGAELAAEVARDGFIDAIGGAFSGLLCWLFWHEVQSLILSVVQVAGGTSALPRSTAGARWSCSI